MAAQVHFSSEPLFFTLSLSPSDAVKLRLLAAEFPVVVLCVTLSDHIFN